MDEPFNGYLIFYRFGPYKERERDGKRERERDIYIRINISTASFYGAPNGPRWNYDEKLKNKIDRSMRIR